MSKALVIKGANFSTNAVAHITIGNPAPCTGISLNKSTTSITSIGDTETLTATVTPSDTTDQIVWSNSDNTVATVNNGTVTAVGLGSAVITATCGNYSATCTVTVRAILNDMDVTKLISSSIGGDTAVSGGNGLPTITSVENRGSFVKTTGLLHYYRPLDNVDYYPVVMPANTARLKITYNNFSSIYIGLINLFNAETAADGYPAVAKLINKITSSQCTPDSGTNYKIVDIPFADGYPSINAIGLSLRKSSGDFTVEDFDEVTIEFLPAA